MKPLFYLIFLVSCTPTFHSPTPITTPQVFARGVISLKDKDVYNIFFAPSGKTIYFTWRKGDEKQKIYTSNFKNKTWSNPLVCSFSTDRDETPFVTPDGQIMYFGSTRPIEGKTSKGNFDMNIWQSKWTGKTWGNPTPLPDVINAIQIEKEEWPSSNENFIYTNDGTNFLISTMLRGTKSIEIYETRLQNNTFSPLVKINELMDQPNIWKSSAVLSPDGKYLVFNAYGANGGFGGEDMWVSQKVNGKWIKAKNLGSIINTKNEEGSPRFSPDGKYFFYIGNLGTDPAKADIANILYIETKSLYLPKLFSQTNNQ